MLFLSCEGNAIVVFPDNLHPIAFKVPGKRRYIFVDRGTADIEFGGQLVDPAVFCTCDQAQADIYLSGRRGITVGELNLLADRFQQTEFMCFAAFDTDAGAGLFAQKEMVFFQTGSYGCQIVTNGFIRNM